MKELFEALARALKSPAFKFALVAFLILLLLIPLFIVRELISEREQRARSVRYEVGRIWGPDQSIVGPVLIVPYTIRYETVQGEKRVEQIQERRAIFTPDTLDVNGRTETKTLQRSIFEVPVYNAKLKLNGRFGTPNIADVAANVVEVRWRDAVFALALSGVAGLKEAAVLKIDGAGAIPFAPSLGMPMGSMTGIHAKLTEGASSVITDTGQPPRAFTFSVDLAFNGSVSMQFAPVARETSIRLASDWPHPSFEGAFLPDERTIDDKGFRASWKIPHLARSVPEAWSSQEAGIERLSPYTFGVQMIAPVDFYSLVDRASKYGILFLTLAFMAVFTMELTSGRRVHAVQYLFTGIALVFFYVLLLSLAEHIGFALAYTLASAATGIMLATYIGAALASLRKGLVMLAIFVATYALLYFILQLEDYALLAGALLGFVALTLVMFTTLKVDWSGDGARAAPVPAE